MISFPEKDWLKFDIVEFLAKRPHGLNTPEKWAAQKALENIIPFNKPHLFELLEWKQLESKILAPLKRTNKNHIGTMHATCLATIGEFSCGLALVSLFGFTDYRLILKEIKCSYIYQAKTDITAHCKLNYSLIDKLKQGLKANGKSESLVQSQLHDKEGNLVCEVECLWQIKSWDQVKSK